MDDTQASIHPIAVPKGIIGIDRWTASVAE